MICVRCGEEMDHMTVCHQICPKCGSVLDCSDGVEDWDVLTVTD